MCNSVPRFSRASPAATGGCRTDGVPAGQHFNIIFLYSYTDGGFQGEGNNPALLVCFENVTKVSPPLVKIWQRKIV